MTAVSLILLSTAASRTDRSSDVADLREACENGLTLDEATNPSTPTAKPTTAAPTSTKPTSTTTTTTTTSTTTTTTKPATSNATSAAVQQRCNELLGKLARYSYDVRAAAIWLVAVTLLAGVAWALTIIWGGSDEQISDKDKAVASLQRLKQLRDEGILTESEYQERRSKELPGLD